MADDGIRWNDDEIQSRLATLKPKVERAIIAALTYHAPQAVAYARQNARWADRTGNARQGLFARVERGRGVYTLTVAHGVPYGIWLEVRWSGRYGILRQTVQHEGPRTMDTAKRLVRAELG